MVAEEEAEHAALFAAELPKRAEAEVFPLQSLTLASNKPKFCA